MTAKEEAKEKIIKLVAKFKEEFKEPNSKADMNETTTRNGYINPFFEALGWDINNEQNLPANYREVTHEAKQKVGGKTKAPDYLFRILDTPKFFLEAKKLLVSIKTNSEPAKQIRQYGWSNGKTPVAVLTNFEELAIYDCAYMHKDGDGAHIARLKYLHYENYENEFDFLWDVLAKESVKQGSLEFFAGTDTVKKGAISVDVAFLQSLNEWRMELASAIATENLTITENDLNYVVQMTLDRLVFLRIAEDRGIEEENQLQKLLSSKNVYKEFLAYCKESDAKYNSGLFNFKADTTTSHINIPNKTLKFIIEDLYYPKSQYAFGVLPVEILGSVYEQFLGKVIVLGAGNIAKPEEKPEVRKAGGVYYTPEYVVKYIVRETVGKRIAEIEANLQEGQDLITEVAKLKIIDPACGSGSFLLGAYQFLLDWHLTYYHQHAPKDYSLLTPDGNLTAKVKKNILLNNIFGVDLDANAVEVTKLSLLLKALEKETGASIKTMLSTYKERVLPTLDSNILSGNSLVDMDYLKLDLDLTPEQEAKLNAFPWKKKFAQVFAANGFDIVIGNPPYVRHDLFPHLKTYLKRYEVYHGNADLYSFFIEKGLKLLKSDGLYSIIVANKWLKADYGEPLRKFLLSKKIIEVVDFGDLPVFPKVAAYPCILTIKNATDYNNQNIQQEEISKKKENVDTIIDDIITNYAIPDAVKNKLRLEDNQYEKLRTLEDYKSVLNGLFKTLNKIITQTEDIKTKTENSYKHMIRTCLVKTLHFENLHEYVKNHHFYFKQNKLDENAWTMIDDSEAKLLDKIKKIGVPLTEYLKDNVYRGVVTGANEAFVIDENTKDYLIKADAKNASVIKPYLTGKDIKPYETPNTSQYLIFTKRGIDISQYPDIEKYLSKFKSKLEPKPKNYTNDDWQGRKEGTYKWYEIQDSTDYYEEFEKPKIMYQVFQVKPCFIFDINGHFCNNSIWIIPKDDKYLLALLNSKLGWYLIANYCSQIQNGYQLIWKYLSKIPIKIPDLSNQTEKKLHDNIVKNVNEFFKLYEDLQKATLQTKIDAIKNKITYFEDEINEWIFDLYDLDSTDRELILQS